MHLDWICENIRLSLFSTGPVRLSTDDWTNLTGQPEAEQEQKGAGRHVFASPLMGGQLSLGAVGNRCDCILNPLTTIDNISDEYIPSVGRWPNVFEDFRKATETFLPMFRYPINRMAVGVALISPHKESLDAYKALVTQVKSLKHRPEELRDLLFRINWPKSSTVDNSLTLNRLTTWQVQQLQMQIMIPDGTGAGTFVNPITFLLRLEMDHSTDQARAISFDPGRLVPIYSELANLALQNAEQGEVQ